MSRISLKNNLETGSKTSPFESLGAVVGKSLFYYYSFLPLPHKSRKYNWTTSRLSAKFIFRQDNWYIRAISMFPNFLVGLFSLSACVSLSHSFILWIPVIFPHSLSSTFFLHKSCRIQPQI